MLINNVTHQREALQSDSFRLALMQLLRAETHFGPDENRLKLKRLIQHVLVASGHYGSRNGFNDSQLAKLKKSIPDMSLL